MLLCLISISAFGQSKEELELQRKRKLDEIKLTQKLIDATGKEQRKNINYLVILKRQINNREQLIVTEEKVLDMMSSSIESTEMFVEALETDLQSLRDEYKEMAYYAFKNRSNFDYLIYIFASETLQEAWNRLRYVRYYNEIRQNQIDLIKSTQSSLKTKVIKLREQISIKERLIEELHLEKEKLMADRRARNELLLSLRDKEEEYKSKIQEDKKKARELDQAIEEVIAAEMARNEVFSGLSGEKFAENRANFIWPAVGIVSSTFGRHEHPGIRGVYVNNNGIDIRTEQDAQARCIFSGTVVHVVFIPGANNAIIVKHGEYYTVYKNLVEVAVRPGENVAEGQQLGKVFYDENKGAAELHFEVRHKTDKLNPLLWLKKK